MALVEGVSGRVPDHKTGTIIRRLSSAAEKTQECSVILLASIAAGPTVKVSNEPVVIKVKVPGVASI